MPPQVGGPGSGKGRVVVQSHEGVHKTKSANVEKKPSQNKQNATEPSAPHRATPKEKSQKVWEKSMENSRQKAELNEKMKAKEGKPPSPKTMAEAKETASQMGMLQQTVNQVTKSIGEGISTSARK